MGRAKIPAPVIEGRFHVITDDFVKQVKVPQGHTKPNYLYRDRDLVGFGLRVSTTTGRKVFFVEGKQASKELTPDGEVVEAKQRQKAIGVAGPGGHSVAQAREEASRLLSAMRTGRPATTVKTVQWALNDYISQEHLSSETVASMKKCLRLYFSKYQARALNSFDIEECKLIYTAVRKKGGKFGQGAPTQANLMKRYLAAIFEYNAVIPNPWRYVRVIDPPPGRPAVVLEPSDFRRLWLAIQDTRPLARDVLYTLIFTGFRHRALRHLEWKHLDMKRCVYKIAPDAQGFKKGPAVEYPLPVWLVDNVLRRRFELHGHLSPWIFPNRVDPDRPMDHVRGTYKNVGSVVGKALTTYVFRRTRATLTENFFGRTLITSRFLNHRVKPKTQAQQSEGADATAFYTKASQRVLRRYAEAYANIIRQLAGELPMSEKVRLVVLSELDDDERAHVMSAEETDALLDTRVIDVLAPAPTKEDSMAGPEGVALFEAELVAPGVDDDEDGDDDYN